MPGTKVNPVGKILSEVQRAYLAGLIDGDGAIMACIEPHKEKKFKFRIRIMVKITLSYKTEIDWIHSFTKVGYVRRNLRTYEWVVRGKAEAKWVLKMIEPYTHGKKKQTHMALNILAADVSTKKRLYATARLADALSAFNVRSKNRRKNYASMVKESISCND